MKYILLAMLFIPSLLLAQENKSIVPQNGAEALAASQKALGNRQYNLANYYSDIALKDTSTAQKAAEIKIQCMANLMESQQDSAKYIVALLELHGMDINNHVYMDLLLKYFTSPGHQNEMRQFLNDELKRDSSNAFLWEMRGETFMKDNQFDEAITNFKQALEIDSTHVGTIFNIGICYMNKAIQYRDSLLNVDKKLIKQHKEEIKQAFRVSCPWLEKARNLDPAKKIIDWQTPLYQVYLVLGDKRSKELKEK